MERGFSFVEVMVAVTIILVALIPIFATITTVLVYHRNLLDKEMAISILQSVENILDAQPSFYVIKDDEVVNIRNIDDNNIYPLVLITDNTGQPHVRWELYVNNKRFVVTAKVKKTNPVFTAGNPEDNNCNMYQQVQNLYAVLLTIEWKNIKGKIQKIRIARRYYKQQQ